VKEIAASLDESPANVERKDPASTPQVVQAEQLESSLSFQQRDLWFLEQPAHLGLAHDNVQFAFRLEGTLDQDAYVRSMHSVIERHAILRTSYLRRNDSVIQRVNPSDGFDVVIINVANDTASFEWLDAERVRPFYPEDTFMIRAYLLVLSPLEHIGVITRPWGIFDGWSVGALLGDLLATYRAFSQDQEPDLMPLPLSYIDFAIWQQNAIDQAELERQREYWRHQLAGLNPCISLRSDYPRCPVKSYRGATVEFTFPAGILAQLKNLSHQLCFFQ
jgi:hypothetical protein